jgi:hypothetical protein
MSSRSNVVHVEVGPDRESDAARIQRALLVQVAAPKTVRYQNDAAFKAVIDALVAAGVDLDDSRQKVSTLEILLALARAQHVETRQAYDASYNTATAHLEQGGTAVDVVASGFDLLQRVIHGLALPSDIAAKYDRNKSVLNVHVKYPWRNERCIVQISLGASEGPFQTLDGSGVTRKVPNLAVGTWWVRAATMRAAGQSAWFGPVAVTVT